MLEHDSTGDGTATGGTAPLACLWPREVLRGGLDLLLPPRCPACSQRCQRVAFCPDCAARIALLGPPHCAICAQPFRSGPSHLCERCLRRPPHFARVFAAARYRADAHDPLAAVIARFKYGFDVGLAPVLARLLLSLPNADADAVVPVPLHRDRLRWRGFNQAALLARALARARGLPLLPRALQRARNTAPQVGLGDEARRRNMRGAFRVRQPAAVSDRSVLLVDDVFTTGTTADECARVLLRAGARRVDVMVLARAV